MIKTKRAALNDSQPIQLTFSPRRGDKVRFKNSGANRAFISGEDLTINNGWEILAGGSEELTMPDSYHLFGCSEDGKPTELQVLEISQ